VDRPHDVECRSIVNDRVAAWLFHAICVKDAEPPTYSGDQYEEQFVYGEESAQRFFARFRGALEVKGKSVLDIGCGNGNVCLEAARRGARRVVGTDMQPLNWARENLRTRYAEFADRIELVSTDGSLRELGEQQFDVLISKDSFEHYEDPEGLVSAMEQLLALNGVFAIGFGPLWKAPTGGHIDFMTKVPWAHLIFPERTIMAERRRFRPAEDARCFAEIRGGLNKMTLARFEQIMHRSGLRLRYFSTNVSDNPVVRGMDFVRRAPPLREFFTANVYGIWENSTASTGSVVQVGPTSGSAVRAADGYR
jgi:2-polyprenyl-3-methyl-5-hydroxy-6-metoxy-1,4-benzoquinol methylase